MNNDAVIEISDVLNSESIENKIRQRIDVYYLQNKTILKTSYLDGSGIDDTRTNERFFSFYEIDKNSLNVIATPYYLWIGNEEVPEEFYLNINSDKPVSKEQYDEFCQSLIKDSINHNTVILNNNIKNYLDGNNLYNAIEKAYIEYMNTQNK